MGSTEKHARVSRTRRNIQHAVLSAAAVTGAVAVALIAPNIFQLLPKLAGDKYKLSYRARTAAGRLSQKGFVTFVERNGKKFISITDKGRRELHRQLIESEMRSGKKKKWDGRYRLVMFDIPHTRKSQRDQFRTLVQSYGFLRLQNSVWVYPYDCEEIITLVKAEMRFGKHVLYAVVESIENDKSIRVHFGLS